MFFVYIIQSKKNGKFYIGQSENIIRRLEEHNNGKTKSTRRLRPWKLVYTEIYETRKESQIRERQLKGWKNKKRLERLMK